MGCFRAFTADSFRESYKGRLVDQSLRRVYITHQWSSITSSLELPEALLLSTVKDQLLANDYVLQPFGVGSQPSIQVIVQALSYPDLAHADSTLTQPDPT